LRSISQGVAARKQFFCDLESIFQSFLKGKDSISSLLFFIFTMQFSLKNRHFRKKKIEGLHFPKIFNVSLLES